MIKKNSFDIKHIKKEIVIGGIFLVLVVVLIVFLFVKDDSDNVTNNNQDSSLNNVIDDTGNDTNNITEKDIIEVYGFSKNDAKNLISTLFNSDNFEYNVTVSKAGKYIVEVKNVINNNVYKYEVDPMNKTYIEF